MEKVYFSLASQMWLSPDHENQLSVW